VVISKPAIKMIVFPSEDEQEKKLSENFQDILQNSFDWRKMVFVHTVYHGEEQVVVLHKGGETRIDKQDRFAFNFFAAHRI